MAKTPTKIRTRSSSKFTQLLSKLSPKESKQKTATKSPTPKKVNASNKSKYKSPKKAPAKVSNFPQVKKVSVLLTIFSPLKQPKRNLALNLKEEVLLAAQLLSQHCKKWLRAQSQSKRTKRPRLRTKSPIYLRELSSRSALKKTMMFLIKIWKMLRR